MSHIGLSRMGRPISRRQALKIFGAGAVAAPLAATVGVGRLTAAETPPRFGGLDRVEFFVSDIPRSVAFYTRVFGNALYKNNKVEKRYLVLGSTYISMDRAADRAADRPADRPAGDQGPASLRVDHFAAGVEDFQMPKLHAFLDQQGVMYKDYPSGRDLYFLDPDGTRVQLGSINSWKFMNNTASPETAPASSAGGGEAIFKPTGLDHILLNVSDPETSAAFYAKVFGPVSRRDKNRIWFQLGKSRVGLAKTPDGQRVGVNHYCVSAEAFDSAVAARKLEQAGAKMETSDAAGSAEFRDPDGLLIQVTGPGR